MNRLDDIMSNFSSLSRNESAGFRLPDETLLIHRAPIIPADSSNEIPVPKPPIEEAKSKDAEDDLQDEGSEDEKNSRSSRYSFSSDYSSG